MSTIRSFRLASRGNVSMIFGLTLPVIVMVTGMAVDTANVEASKWSMQRSLDAAALGAAKEFGRTQDHATIERWASSIFFANEGRDPADNTRFAYEGVARVDGSNVLRVSATRDEPTYFGSAIKALTGGKLDLVTWHLAVSSEVVVANRSIELALVLDNSGSMDRAPASGGATKIATLKEATKKLVEQMLTPHPEANAKDPVRISVVPFAASVNVGKDYAKASWMDTTGINPSHHDDLDWKTWKPAGIEQAEKLTNGSWRQKVTNTPLTKFWLFERLADKKRDWAWGGCMQSRPLGHAVTDAEPNVIEPATLFVPLFSPSEYNWYPGSFSNQKNDYRPDSGGYVSDQDTAFEHQRDVNKYITGTGTGGGGPNSVCTTKPLTPLTASQATVLTAVNTMQPLGGTNVGEGLAWGWRTLTSGLPFPEGRPRGTKENLKVIVLMTDGENTYNAAYSTGEQIEIPNANRSQYGTYGYGQFKGSDGKVRNGRMFDATKTTTPKPAIANITAAMNETMSLTCENIKKDGTNDEGGDGIVIFSIAFDLKDGSPIKERLRACASNGIDGRSAKLYYDAKNSKDLLSAFAAITDEISALRIAR